MSYNNESQFASKTFATLYSFADHLQNNYSKSSMSICILIGELPNCCDYFLRVSKCFDLLRSDFFINSKFC